jgi:hypothetical protein
MKQGLAELKNLEATQRGDSDEDKKICGAGHPHGHPHGA